MKIYDLTPTDNRKSFYGKAHVIISDDGSETLISYTTPVIKRTPNGELVRLWEGWSMTTGRHIAAFCGINKAEFDKLPTEYPKHDDRLTEDEVKQVMRLRRSDNPSDNIAALLVGCRV